MFYRVVLWRALEYFEPLLLGEEKKRKRETLEDGTRVSVGNIHGNILSPMETSSKKSLPLSLSPSTRFLRDSLFFQAIYRLGTRVKFSNRWRVALVRDFK